MELPLPLQQSEAAASSETEPMTSDLNQSSHSAYHRKFLQVVEAADVVLEVLDARDPLGTRCAAVEQAVLDAGASKKLVLVLNKIGQPISYCCF